MSARRRLRRIKRYAILGAGVGTVIVVRRSVAKRNTTPHVGPPAEWPPLRPAEEPVAAAGDLVVPRPVVQDQPESAETERQSWVAPVDGACPESHPVKVGASGIFHVPGGRFYDRTKPERCYVDEAAAEADGYRAAKTS